MSRLVTLPLVLCAVLALAACGGGGGTDSAGEFEGAEQDVARAIEEAGQEDEPRRICQALLAREVVQRIEQGDGDCVAAIDKALDQADTFALTVESVRVDGDRARAQVASGSEDEKVETLELVRENGAWRVSSLPGAA